MVSPSVPKASLAQCSSSFLTRTGLFVGLRILQGPESLETEKKTPDASTLAEIPGCPSRSLQSRRNQQEMKMATCQQQAKCFKLRAKSQIAHHTPFLLRSGHDAHDFHKYANEKVHDLDSGGLSASPSSMGSSIFGLGEGEYRQVFDYGCDLRSWSTKCFTE